MDAPVLLLPSRPLGVCVSWQWKLFAASPSSSRRLSTQLEIRQRHISNDDNGRQRILTGPIQRHIQLFLPYGQEKETESHSNMGSLSRSSRRRATRNQRQFTPLLQALSQSILVNPHIWQRPLSPQKGSSHI
ncbi:Uncharacterized protein HZ326_31161, partial [Fusarium oxysporum f. sp. albedinis]